MNKENIGIGGSSESLTQTQSDQLKDIQHIMKDKKNESITFKQDDKFWDISHRTSDHNLVISYEGREMLAMAPDGNFYIEGKLLTKDEDIYKKFKFCVDSWYENLTKHQAAALPFEEAPSNRDADG